MTELEIHWIRAVEVGLRRLAERPCMDELGREMAATLADSLKALVDDPDNAENEPMPLNEAQTYTARIGALAVVLERVEREIMLEIKDDVVRTEDWESLKDILFSILPELEHIQELSRIP
jgi:hypothetical protein